VALPADPDLESCIFKVMAQGHEKSSAIAICRSSLALSDQPVVRWIEPFQYNPGAPFRVMPVGTFKRGERTLEITPERIREMAANYEAGRPRWNIPIYFGHPTEEKPDPPKAGNVKRLFVRDDGLYAEPEFTPEGEKAIADGAYQYESPGVLWKLNGSAYTDEHGKEHDNIIDHVALTNRPFFGQNVALFSADGVDLMADHSDSHLGAMKKAMTKMRELAAAMMDAIGGWTGDLPEHKRPVEEQADTKKETATEPVVSKKEQMMTDKTDTTVVAVTPAPEQFTVSAEEFATLKAKADKVEALEARATELGKQAETFAADLAKERDARRLDLLIRRCEQFMAIAETPATLAAHLQKLENLDAGEFKYFDELLTTLDRELVQTGLFSQRADARKGENAETFEAVVEKVLAEKFGGDREKYADAMNAAQKARPDLADEYLHASRAR